MTPSPSPPAMPAMPAELLLLPCPFCGATKLREGQGSCYFIECEQCFDEFGTTVCAEGDARHDAIAMWNRRPALSRPERTPVVDDTFTPEVKREMYRDSHEMRLHDEPVVEAALSRQEQPPTVEPPKHIQTAIRALAYLLAFNQVTKQPSVFDAEREAALKYLRDELPTALSTLSRQSGRGGEAT